MHCSQLMTKKRINWLFKYLFALMQNGTKKSRRQVISAGHCDMLNDPPSRPFARKLTHFP